MLFPDYQSLFLFFLAIITGLVLLFASVSALRKWVWQRRRRRVVCRFCHAAYPVLSSVPSACPVCARLNEPGHRARI